MVCPKDIRKETEEIVVGPTYLPPLGYLRSNWSQVQAYEARSQVQGNTIIRLEFNPYGRKEWLLIVGEHS